MQERVGIDTVFNAFHGETKLGSLKVREENGYAHVYDLEMLDAEPTALVGLLATLREELRKSGYHEALINVNEDQEPRVKDFWDRNSVKLAEIRKVEI